MTINEIKEKHSHMEFIHTYYTHDGCEDEWGDAHKAVTHLLYIIKETEDSLVKMIENKQIGTIEYNLERTLKAIRG